MGLLDDAIREHLDLKRRRGADPAEIERAEREALGPVRREPGPAPTFDDEAPMRASAEAATEVVSVGAIETEEPDWEQRGDHDAPVDESHHRRRGLFHWRSKTHDDEPDFAALELDGGRVPPAADLAPGHIPDEALDADPDDAEPDVVEARDVQRRDLEARDVEARDVEARDVEARDVEAYERAAGVDRPEPDPADELPMGGVRRIERTADRPSGDRAPTQRPSGEHPPAGDPGASAEFREDEIRPAAEPSAQPPPVSAGSAPATPGTPGRQPPADEHFGETVEYDVEGTFPDGEPAAPAHGAGAEAEDVLEETPEFLQDTPDHDRLWFEQRPPKDFDFDG